MQHGARREEGGAVLIALLLIACLLIGLAAGFLARALTGEKKSGKAASAATSTMNTKAKAYSAPVSKAHSSVAVEAVAGSAGTTGAGAAAASFNAGRAMSHVAFLASKIGAREEGTPGEAAAATYLRSQLEALGYPVSVQEVPIAVGGRVTRNVIATLGGTERPARTIIVGAHMDSLGGPGANDNATGCAVALELARVLKSNNRQVPNIRFVFFGGGEAAAGGSPDDRHWGSRYFVANLAPADRNALAGMVQVDMVGAGDRFLATSTDQAKPTVKDMLLASGAGRGLTYMHESGMSDNEAFEKAGVPSVWVEFSEPTVRGKPSDVPSTVPAEHVAVTGAMLQEFFESYLTAQRVDQL
jgi:Zn-dependent M28 family amino/carboxypeptidase